MNKLTAAEIADLRATVAAMTPGDWLADAEAFRLDCEMHAPMGYAYGSPFTAFAQDCKNADGIVALRNNAERLIAAAERGQRIEAAARAYTAIGEARYGDNSFAQLTEAYEALLAALDGEK